MPEQDTAFDLDEILMRVAAETHEMLHATTDLERGYQEVVAPTPPRSRRRSSRRHPRRPPT